LHYIGGWENVKNAPKHYFVTLYFRVTVCPIFALHCGGKNSKSALKQVFPGKTCYYCITSCFVLSFGPKRCLRAFICALRIFYVHRVAILQQIYDKIDKIQIV